MLLKLSFFSDVHRAFAMYTKVRVNLKHFTCSLYYIFRKTLSFSVMAVFIKYKSKQPRYSFEYNHNILLFKHFKNCSRFMMIFLNFIFVSGSEVNRKISRDSF